MKDVAGKRHAEKNNQTSRPGLGLLSTLAKSKKKQRGASIVAT